PARPNVNNFCCGRGSLNREPKIAHQTFERPRRWRFWKAVSAHLAGEFRISQSLADDAADNLNEASRIVIFAFVEPKRLLVQIPEQMKRLDVHIRSVDSAFEQRPKVLKS